MLKLGSLTLGGNLPRVAVGFSDQVIALDIEEAKNAGLDVAEIRVDQFRSHEIDYVTQKLALFKGMPSIGTIRLEQEGGAWSGPENDRQKLFQVMLPHVDALDIELNATETLNSLAALIKDSGKTLIVSYHDMKTTPSFESLQKTVQACEDAGADIVKIATNIENDHPEQMEILTSLLLQNSKKNLIVIGMGGHGVITRLLFPRLGSLITFAFTGDVRTAGQLPYDKMFELLRQMYPAYNQEKIIKIQLLECV